MSATGLSPAQAVLLQRAVNRHPWSVSVRSLRTAEALVGKGLLRHIGPSPTITCGTAFVVTDAGRAALAATTPKA